MANNFCGIVFINGGSSWAYADTPETAATKAALQCKRDWSTLIDFSQSRELKVCIYEMTNHDGWYADHNGVHDDKTDQSIPLLRVERVAV